MEPSRAVEGESRPGHEPLAPPGSSLRAAILDGMWFSVMTGAGETYLTPFGIFLKATTFQIGLLATVPPLFGAIAQGLGVWLMERFASRRTFIAAGAALQALVWLPIALVPFFMESGSNALGVLIALVACYHVTGNTVGPAWNSLIGDLVPSAIRGRFFGRRNQLTGFCTFVAMVVAGSCLDICARSHSAATGYLSVFLVALVARLLSARWLGRYDDPPYESPPDQRFSFWQFLRRARDSNFAKFVLFVSAMNFGVAFSGPYFAVYMLRDLRLSYFEYTLISAALMLTQFLTMHYWGALADRFGNKKLLTVCGWGIAVVPVMWLVSANSFYLVLIQTYAGFAWAGFSLASASFMFDAVAAAKRARCAAHQAIICAVFVFAGSLAGGLAAGHLPQAVAVGSWTWIPRSPLLLVFLVSTVVRFVALALCLPLFSEVRDVEPISSRDLVFRIVRLRPATGATFGFFGQGSRA
ncbi:MAG: MFS transporter [Candidatus Riflebacteria bacterium]|nr:MFS transporter [Candidatus Riflebacteria bacterium]